MIVLERVTARLRERTRTSIPLEEVSVRIPGDRRVGILGGPKSGKTTLLRLLSGLQRPVSGRILTDGTISFPVGAQIGIVSSHTLRRNATTAARLYRVDPVEMVRTVSEAANLRAFLDTPFDYLPTDISAKFKYALSYALPFDTYLMDGMPLPFMHDPARMQDLLASRLSKSGFILCSGNENLIEKYCDTIFLLRDRKVVELTNGAAGIAAFRAEKRERNQAGVATDDLKVLVREARDLLRAREFAAAELKAHECYEKYPDTLETFLLLADVALANGKRPEGTEVLKRACDMYPNRDEPWVALQKLFVGQNDPESVLPWARKMVEHKTPRVQLGGARLVAALGTDQDALEAWRKTVGPEPKTTIGLSQLAILELKTGNYEQALATLQIELTLDPGSWQALVTKAKAERALGRYDDVAATAIQLAEMRPDFSMPYVAVLRRSGHTDAAERLSRAIQGFA